MPVPRGTEVYNADMPPVMARGLILTEEEFNDARTNIERVLGDEAGREELTEFCVNLELTEFATTNLAEALRPIPTDEQSIGWREGEALAEVWLNEHRECDFPWPFNRDLRHHRASLPGAELVGFTGIDDEARFAFGQVKTSKEVRHPPQVVNHGETSLINQMLQLRDDTNIKKTLTNYLLYRAIHDDAYSGQARAATKRWLESGFMDIVIFGVLVRDVVYSRDDLLSAATNLCEGCHQATRIEFWALYLPAGSIPPGPQHHQRVRRRLL